MRSSSYRRRARANDLRVFVRDDVPNTAEDDMSDSDSESEGEPDTPSPTSPDFPSSAPSGTSDTATSSTVSPGSTQPTEGITSPGDTQGALSQNNEALQAQVSDGGTDTPGMSKDGAIAFGAVGGAVIVAAIVFLIWKCRRRRRNHAGGGLSGLSPFSGFNRMEDPQQRGTVDYRPPGKTQSKTMDDLIAAAYAAEDGNASQYGAYADEKQQMNASMYAPQTNQPMPMRQSRAPGPRASSGTSNSLYVNQLLSGFYKGPKTDGLAVPGNARMPPPAAPSVAGETVVTATTESTWKTWGWSQPKKPKETWVDKMRFGGSK